MRPGGSRRNASFVIDKPPPPGFSNFLPEGRAAVFIGRMAGDEKPCRRAWIAAHEIDSINSFCRLGGGGRIRCADPLAY